MEFLQLMPSITSLGTWEDFNNFEETMLIQLSDIHLNNLHLCNINLSTMTNLSKLCIKMTNSSYKLHTLAILSWLTELVVSDVNYRQSRLGVAVMGLSGAIQTLCLEHVNGWDTTDFRSMGQHCKHLG